jgi:hypothetical protein
VEGAEAVGTGSVGTPSSVATGGGRDRGDGQQRWRGTAQTRSSRQREGAVARPSRLDSRHREESPLVAG